MNREHLKNDQKAKHGSGTHLITKALEKDSEIPWEFRMADIQSILKRD
jgi:hypothetical protein